MFIFGDTRQPKKNQENPKNLVKHIVVVKSRDFETPFRFDIFQEDGHRTMMKIRVTKSRESWIWDQYLPENICKMFLGISKNYEYIIEQIMN